MVPRVAPPGLGPPLVCEEEEPLARGRMISKTLGSSRRFADLGRDANLGEFAQALYTLCVCHADDFGNGPGDAFTVKHRIFPTSPRTEPEFAAALELMAQVGLITLYDADDTRVMVITQFDVHQQGLHKRTKSKFPCPSDNGQAPAQETGVLLRAKQDIDRRVSAFLESYPALYQEIMGQPYVQTRVQMERDLEAARVLCAAYDQDALDRLVRLFLSVDEANPKAKLLRGSQRTLPKLVTMVGSLANALKVQGGS